MSAKGAIARLAGAYDQYNGLLRDQMGQAQASYQPYQQAGTRALNALADPGANFQASPDYQWRLNQGLGAVTQNKAVNGLLKSGSALKALNSYGQGAASQEFGNWWQRQAGLAGTGFNAANALTQVGLNTAGQMGQNAVGLAAGTTAIKQANQARNDGLLGGAIGVATNIATGGLSGGLSSLGGLWGSLGGLAGKGSTGGGAFSAAVPGIGGYQGGDFV